MSKFPVFFLTVLLSYQLSYALDINFEQAKEMAVKNSRMIKAVEEDEKASSYRKNQAYGGYSPQINFEQTYMDTNEPANAAFARMAQGRFDMDYFLNQLKSPERQRNHRSKIEVIQPLFMNGKILYGIKQAKRSAEAANYTKKHVEQSVILGLYRSFYGLALAQRGVDVVNYSHERTQEYYKRAQEFFNNGLIVKSDLLVAESYLLMSGQAVKEAEKNKAVAESYLQMLLDTDEDLKAVCNEWNLNVEGTIEDYTAKALELRNDVKVMKLMTDISKLEKSKASAGYAPEVMLFADYQRNDEKMFADSGEGTTFGAMMKFNVFNGLKDYNSVQEKESTYLASLHRFADLKLQVKADVKGAFYTVSAAEKKLEFAKKQVESAKSALDITKNRFDEGLSRITELLDREVEFKQAELSVCISEYELVTARASLLFASGLLN